METQQSSIAQLKEQADRFLLLLSLVFQNIIFKYKIGVPATFRNGIADLPVLEEIIEKLQEKYSDSVESLTRIIHEVSS